MHLSLELYTLVLDGRLPPAALATAAHRHLLACCPTCRLEHEHGGGETGREPFAEPRGPAAPRAPLLVDERHLSTAAYDDLRRRLSSVRSELRRAREDVRELMALPAAERAARIARSTTRFASPACAERLLQTSCARLATDPAEAESLAALVPAVLDRIAEDERGPWVDALLARAAAVQNRRQPSPEHPALGSPARIVEP